MGDDTSAATAETGTVRPGVFAGVVAIALGISACMTITWLGMRGIMDLGGFVASGGPYVIAHQAPGWVWLLPVSLVLLVVLMFASQEMNSAYDTPSLMLLTWSLLFLTLGFNFLTYGLNPPGGGGLAWGWLVCAVAFFAMGAGGLWALRDAVKVGWEYDRKKAAEEGRPVRPGFAAYAIGTGIAMVLGIPVGVSIFNAVVG